MRVGPGSSLAPSLGRSPRRGKVKSNSCLGVSRALQRTFNQEEVHLVVKEVRMTVLMHLPAQCAHAASSSHDCSDQTKDAPELGCTAVARARD